MQTLPDACDSYCFAQRDGRCRILLESYGNKLCPFYKSPEQFEKDQAAAEARCKRLGIIPPDMRDKVYFRK